MLYKVRYRYHSQAEAAFEFHDVAQPRDGPVIIHEFAQDATWVKARKYRQVNGRLGVTRALKHPAGPRTKRKDMPRTRQFSRL